MTEHGRWYWERCAPYYDRATSFVARPIPRMLELVAVAARGRKRVLEVGAGTGIVTAVLADVAGEVVATDYSESMVGQLWQRTTGRGIRNVHCSRADLYRLPYPPGRFDAVVAANVLHLVRDVPLALECLVEMLRPDGVLIVPTYCYGETLRARIASRVVALTRIPAARPFTRSSLAAALEAARIRVGHAETIAGPIPVGYLEGTRIG